MTATRSTKESRLYYNHLSRHKNKKCPFCEISKLESQYVEETNFLPVIRNLYPYSLWDGQGVVDHLMIIPKQHTDKLGSLSAKAAAEYISLVDKYESAGYNFYARAPNSIVKTVSHHHTHMIRLNGKQKRVLILLRKPFYIRLSLS